MSELEPQQPAPTPEEIQVPLSGPGIVSSLDSPPRPTAVKVHQAVIRKHLLEQQTQHER